MEAENQKVANEKAQEEVNAKEVIFWAPAKGYQIANFRKEERSGGHIMQGEEPLQFRNHLHITTESEVVEFIEKSNGFKNGQIQRCKDMAEAQMLTNAVKIKRQQKNYNITSGGPDGQTDEKIQKVVGA